MADYRRIAPVLFFVLNLAITAPVAAQGKILTELDRMEPRELAVGGFTLDDEQEVSIEAVGFRYRGGRDERRISPAWILNSESREVVWTLGDADSKKVSRHLNEYKDEVRLPRGRYEVYYSSFPYRFQNDWEIDGIGDVISGVIRGIRDWDFDDDDYEDAAREFTIIVRGEGESRSRDEIERFHDRLKEGALVTITGVENDHYETIALNLDKKLDLKIYAVGEIQKDGNYDCSWIVDTRTNKKVWALDYFGSDPAGGARKNRMFRDVVTLPAGSYAVFCVTDNSHHTGDWNSPPPYDPYFWGLTIRAADADMAKYAKTGEYENVAPDDVIVELVRLGDSDFESKGFTLKKPMKLRVYAIGEGSGHTMYDYGWITDANTHEVVWEMDYRDTEHAGGASKNRFVDEVIELDKGEYIACAATDGSHSYEEWNASPPHDKTRWGLTVLIAEGDRKDVADYEEKADENVLARIIGVGDREHKKERFTLDRDAKVRIYALGEGSGGDMYDYAWIEDARTGRTVWEMTYRKTDHAGGARKNRVFNDTVSLDAGEYVVFYESDGSHSFEEWNAAPPADRVNWGVTIRKQ